MSKWLHATLTHEEIKEIIPYLEVSKECYTRVFTAPTSQKIYIEQIDRAIKYLKDTSEIMPDSNTYVISWDSGGKWVEQIMGTLKWYNKYQIREVK